MLPIRQLAMPNDLESEWRQIVCRSAPAIGEAAIPALGALTAAAGLVLWLANPYLALLLVPAAHVWLLAAGRPGASR